MIGDRALRQTSLDPHLRAARRRVALQATRVVLMRAATVMLLPASVLFIETQRREALVVALLCLPGLVWLASYVVWSTCARFDHVAAALAPKSEQRPERNGLAAVTRIDDATQVLASQLETALRDLDRAETERTAAVERERLTAEGMSSLFLRRVYAEERAMAILSAELHDTVAQSLLAAQYSAESGAPLHEVHAEIRTAERQLRGVLALTSPPELDAGLADAVRRLSVELHQQFELEVEVIAWPSDLYQVEQSAATTTYRFYQETLRNVVKHSGTRRATLSLAVDQAHLVARVSDTGTGFDPQRVRPSAGRHVGLYLMDDRARAVGGELVIDSALGRGTVATIRVPLTSTPVAAADDDPPRGVNEVGPS